MTKSEKVPILGIFSPKTILMFRVGLKKLGLVGNRNHTYISFKPNNEIAALNWLEIRCINSVYNLTQIGIYALI